MIKRGDRITFIEDGTTRTGTVIDLAGAEVMVAVDGDPGDSFIPLLWIV